MLTHTQTEKKRNKEMTNEKLSKNKVFTEKIYQK